MRALIAPTILLAAPALASDAPTTFQASDVRIFERINLGPDVALVAFGVMEDSRCASRNFCFDEDDTLVIDTVLSWRGKEREVPLTIGQPHRLPGGTVTMVATSTPPSAQGAIPLRRYRLTFRYSLD